MIMGAPTLFSSYSRDLKDTQPHLELVLPLPAGRLVGNDLNDITFFIPVHLMNIEGMTVDVARSIALGLNIGGKKFWSGLHDLTLQPAGTPPTSLGTVSPKTKAVCYTQDISPVTVQGCLLSLACLLFL